MECLALDAYQCRWWIPSNCYSQSSVETMGNSTLRRAFRHSQRVSHTTVRVLGRPSPLRDAGVVCYTRLVIDNKWYAANHEELDAQCTREYWCSVESNEGKHHTLCGDDGGAQQGEAPHLA